MQSERRTVIQKDVFDLAMKKITAQAELEMISLELQQLIEKNSKDINFEALGLDLVDPA